MFPFGIVTAEKIAGWFNQQRTEYSRLKDRYKHLKSGCAAPPDLTGRALWRWGVFSFLWDHIVGRNKGQVTQVGYCIQHNSFSSSYHVICLVYITCPILFVLHLLNDLCCLLLPRISAAVPAPPGRRAPQPAHPKVPVEARGTAPGKALGSPPKGGVRKRKDLRLRWPSCSRHRGRCRKR